MLNWMLGRNTVNVNNRSSIFAIIYIAVIGPCVFILQPGFVQGLVEQFNFTEQQAGHIISAEMFGLALTTILLNFIVTRFAWRYLILLCVIISAIGNFLSISQTNYETLLAMRFITGLGSGGLISLTFTMMGLTQQADRNFAYIIVGVLSYGALGLLFMPVAYQTIGMNGVMMFFSIFCLSGLFVIRYLPNSSTQNAHNLKSAVQYKPSLKTISLFAILFYNIAIGLVWAYIFLIGLEAGIAEQAVANALTISQFLGIAGALLTVMLETKFGRALPLIIGIAGSVVGVYLLIGVTSFDFYLVGVCLFNFLWNLSLPYLLAILADFDRTGKIVMRGVAMQMVGLAIGPYFAAEILGKAGYNGVNWVAIGLFIVSAILLLPALFKQQSKGKQQSKAID